MNVFVLRKRQLIEKHASNEYWVEWSKSEHAMIPFQKGFSFVLS